MKNKKNRILITGASGFLGKNLTKVLKSTGDILCLTSFSAKDDAGYLPLDLLKPETLTKKITEFRPDIIYHLGALVDLSRDYNIGKNCLEINTIGTLNLLEAVRHSNLKHFIFASTEEIYGGNKTPYKEDQLPDPPSPYAVSKIAAENLCKINARENGYALTICRIGTMYGPGQPVRRLFPQIINKALNSEDIQLNSGEKSRDYVYVGDVVCALILIKDKLCTNKSDIVNIGGGVSYKLNDIANKIIKLTKSKSNLLLNSLPDRILEADYWLMDIQKMQGQYGWKPERSIDDGLSLMIKSMQNPVSR